jgi:hypothetical protein
VTEGIHLLAQGVPITLLDGTEVNVRYGMRGVALLEDAFGTLPNIETALVMDLSRPIVGPTCRALACGLSHVIEGGARMTVDQLQNALIDRLDPRRLREYVEAVAAALSEAFPTAVTPEEPLPNGTGRLAPAPSRGGSTGTSRSRGSGSPPPSSGT